MAESSGRNSPRILQARNWSTTAIRLRGTARPFGASEPASAGIALRELHIDCQHRTTLIGSIATCRIRIGHRESR